MTVGSYGGDSRPLISKMGERTCDHGVGAYYTTTINMSEKVLFSAMIASFQGLTIS